MNNQFQRKFKTKTAIFKEKYLKPKFFIKAGLMFLVIFLLTPLALYLIIYSGYSQKLLTETDQIPDELTTGVLISDQNTENLKNLTDLALESYQKRKISELYIYLIGDAKTSADETVLKLLDKIPPGLIKINRESNSPIELCKSSKDLYSLDKFIILSYKDLAVRTSFICNNDNIYTKAIIPEVSEAEIGIRNASISEYLKDVAKVFSGGQINL